MERVNASGFEDRKKNLDIGDQRDKAMGRDSINLQLPKQGISRIILVFHIAGFFFASIARGCACTSTHYTKLLCL